LASKVERLDQRLAELSPKNIGEQVRKLVIEIYGIDLQVVSDKNVGKQARYRETLVTELLMANSRYSREAVHTLSKVEFLIEYLNSTGERSPERIRELINDIFGINLYGISSLEGKGLALYSKGQWLVKGEQDLFILHTSASDEEVWIYPTEYFQHRRDDQLWPESFKHRLETLGFVFDDERKAYSYREPTGASIPNDFKVTSTQSVLEEIACIRNKMSKGEGLHS
jgi:hypothetical protein